MAKSRAKLRMVGVRLNPAEIRALDRLAKEVSWGMPSRARALHFLVRTYMTGLEPVEAAVAERPREEVQA